MIVREDRRERDDAIAKRRGGKKVKKQEEEKEALKPGDSASKDDDNAHDNLDCDDKDHKEDDFSGFLMSVVHLCFRQCSNRHWLLADLCHRI